MKNEKKCDKYESFFVFQNEQDFNEHLKHCPDCLEEHKKFLKVSELVKEAAPAYLLKKQKEGISAVKKLACCFVFFIGITAFTGYKMYDNYMVQVNSDYDSYITAMGLPVDDYGFLDL